jgi:Xaa-Pro aminopeptidase
MVTAGVDAVIATTPENVRYLTGFFGLAEWSTRLTQAYAVEVPGWPTVLVVSRGELDMAFEDVVDGVQVRAYGDFVYEVSGGGDRGHDRMVQWVEQSCPGNALAALRDALVEKGLVGKRVGLDETGLAPGMWESLQDGSTKFLPAYDLLRSVRAVKSPAEVEALRRVAVVTQDSALAAVRDTRIGDTEAALARRFHCNLVQNDVVPEVTVVGSGPRSVFPNAQAGRRRILKGDLVRLDLCAFDWQYHSDWAGTAVAGIPTPEQKATYAALVAGHLAAIEAVKPGVRACDVFDVAVKTVRESGLPAFQRHHCGHGIGLEGYDAPLISRKDTTVLEPGMVLCVEVPLYRLGSGGYQMEDTLVITENGARVLTSAPLELLIIE